LDRHQGEATASQLGWHPAEPHPMSSISDKKLLKKGEKLHEGGLSQNPQKTKQKQKRNIKLKENNRHKKKHLCTGTYDEGTLSGPRKSEESEATPITKHCLVSNEKSAQVP